MIKELINKIGIGINNKLTLVKKTAKVNFYWEDSDKWFCNVIGSKQKSSFWIIAKDLENHISIYVNNGYKIK